MANDSGIDNQFIFREIEFEDESFHAATFVAKYRRVTSLESLRDQLRHYCDALKQHLYSIINRDYKDFITIATKLDGVDVRAEHLRKPLVDLRLDLASLHDGMVSSMQTIEDKLQRREEVVTKRRIVEATIACIEKLDVAEEIVMNVHQQEQIPLLAAEDFTPGAVIGTSSSLRRRALLKSFSKSHRVSAFSSLSRDVFDCSELERGAYAAAQAQRFLSALPSSVGAGGASMNQRQLEQRLNKLIEQLVQRIRARLSAIFSAAISASASVTASKAEDSASSDASASGSSFPSRAFAHCLRALVALSKGDVAEEVVAETVTCPLAKVLLTQGRVDGVGGRGSYLGLQSALESLASQVMAALAQPLKAFSETFPDMEVAISDSLASSSSGSHKCNKPISTVSTQIDFIVNGVWVPVAAMLEEKFPGMFSVGIAGTLSRCYMAVESFVAMLEKCDSTSSTSTSTPSLEATKGKGKVDFSAHPAILQFHSHWKLDLYLQLRTQEIFSRLDRVCHLVEQHGLITKVLEDVYSLHPMHESGSVVAVAAVPQISLSGTPGPGLASGHAVSAYNSPSITLVPTLTAAELQSLRSIDLSTIKNLNLSLSEAFCIEMSTCLHSSVALRALSTRFFALSVRLVMRLEAHAAVMAEVATPSFSKASLTVLIQQQQQRQLQNGGVPSIIMTPSGTPSKALITPASISSSLPSAHSNIATASVDDLVLLAFDLDTVATWLGTHFGPLAAKALGIPLGSLSDSPEYPLQICLQQQQKRLIGTRVAVWGRICIMLGAECKKGLTAVRAVAAKYRMTNKPAPDVPSPYVETVLLPYRNFLKRHRTLPDHLVGTADGCRWEVAVLEDVTAEYLMQVQALMETVRQMDSALQRRSKLRNAAPTGTNMSDSDKISLQLYLDVKAYTEAVSALSPLSGAAPVPSFTSLLLEVAPAEKLCVISPP